LENKMRKPLIPFWMMPGSWGLRGKTREIAQAEYELRQGDLEKKLLEINYRDDPKELARRQLELSRKLREISDIVYDQHKLRLEIDDQTTLELAELDLLLKHEKLTKLEYDRKRADILKEPWVSMPVINWDPLTSSRTYFQLEYNEYFYPHLLANGYEGEEDTVINNWLNDICISITEEINGMEADLITPTRRADPLDN